MPPAARRRPRRLAVPLSVKPPDGQAGCCLHPATHRGNSPPSPPPPSLGSPAPKQVASFPIGVWSGVFLLLSAADHLLVVLPGVNAIYNRRLCENRNPFRWAEYSGGANGGLG